MSPLLRASWIIAKTFSDDIIISIHLALFESVWGGKKKDCLSCVWFAIFKVESGEWCVYRHPPPPHSSSQEIFWEMFHFINGIYRTILLVFRWSICSWFVVDVSAGNAFCGIFASGKEDSAEMFQRMIEKIQSMLFAIQRWKRSDARCCC